MSDGYISDGQIEMTVFESDNNSSGLSSSSEESDEEYDGITNMIITNKEKHNIPINERPVFTYINHNDWKNKELLSPSLEFMNKYRLRVSKFDIIGSIAKRTQTLSRGGYPLVLIQNNQTESDVVLTEIDSGVFPYVIKHDNLLLKFKDFESIGFKFHLENIKSNLRI